MQVKIEKGIPIPPPVRLKGEEMYPWADMVPGDSFIYKGTEHAANTNCTSKGKKYHMKFSYRKIDGKIRIWRTE